MNNGIQAIVNFQAAAQQVEAEIATKSFSSVGDLNNRLLFTERQFLNPAGLPERPYFLHTIQAPGMNRNLLSNFTDRIFKEYSKVMQQKHSQELLKRSNNNSTLSL